MRVSWSPSTTSPIRGSARSTRRDVLDLKRMSQPARVVIVGAGPVGLLAALHARRLGSEVELWADRLPAYHDRLHIECVPAQTIALLVDYGVPPASMGVDRLFEQRYLQ